MGSLNWDLLSSYAGLLILASGSVYVGSLGSVKHVRGEGETAGRESDDDDDDDIDERVSSGDAWLFPAVSYPRVVLYTSPLMMRMQLRWAPWRCSAST
jgi:minor histocompatibility antigen H13